MKFNIVTLFPDYFSLTLKQSLLEIDLNENINFSETKKKMIQFQDFIPRHNSCATVLIEGVKPDEAPELATLWTILGFQLTSVAIPTWVEAGKELPTLLIAFIISFIFSFGELGTTIMLYPPGTEIMPIKVFTIMANAPQSLTSSMTLIVFSVTILLLSTFYFVTKPLLKKYNFIRN